MTDMVDWEFASKKGILELHVSDYTSVYDALYEYPKNLDEAGANRIHVDFLYDKSMILVYGDSKGMTIDDLDQIRKSVGISSKDEKHHGIGLLSFIRFAKKMLIFSKKDGKINVLSCMIYDDRIVSDIGAPRQVSSNEQAYLPYYSRLERWDEGTITILEDVGKYKSPHYKFFTFDMKTEFESKKFEKWYKEKVRFRLISHTYMVKFGDEKPHKVETKLGHGKKVHFSIPSKEYPANDIPGQNKDTFVQDGFMYKLETDFQFHISQSNDGEIKIGENWQDPISINDLETGRKLARGSIYYNTEYLKYLTGYVNFKIKPLNGGPQFNVYSGSRSKILVSGSWGDCLLNILTYADVDIIRPMIEDKEDRSSSRKDEMRSKNIQADMEAFFRDNKDLFDTIINTKNTDAVSDRSYQTCLKCGTTAIPKRCTLAEYTADPKKTGHIYAPEDLPSYICGNCGRKWPRRIMDRREPDTSHKTTQKPVYDRSSSGGGLAIRKKERGYGYTYSVFDFGKTDPRDVFLAEGQTVVKINRGHPNYHTLNENNSAGLGLYERHLAISAILSRELREFPRDQFEKHIKESLNRILVWYFSDRKRMSAEEIEEARNTEDVINNAKSLADRWGAKVSSGK